MQSDDHIDIPDVIPVMILGETVFFPHSVMPLYIFEERYRVMLEDVLQKHRLFAVFKESDLEKMDGKEDVPEEIGTVGVVRAAHANPDGTSNLALQGIARVRLLEIVQTVPYPLIRVEVCEDETPDETLRPQRRQILNLLESEPTLTEGLPEEYIDFLRSLEDPKTFIDVAIHSICGDADIKQTLLETLKVVERYRSFERYLLKHQNQLDLFERLQGNTRDDEIDLN